MSTRSSFPRSTAPSPTQPGHCGRRQLLKSAVAAGSVSALAGVAGPLPVTADDTGPAAAPQDVERVVRHGRIRQSVVQWCFNKHWSLEQTCRIAKRLGCASVELVGPDQWATLRKYGLTCAITGSHSFVQGMNNPRYHDGCVARIKQSIDAAAEAGVPTVITFTGFAQETGDWNGGSAPDLAPFQGQQTPIIAPDEGIRHCIEGYKKVVGYAESKGVNLSLEMLNSRVDEHMKGHPGYQGDHTDYCLEIIRGVGSPRLGLLFDIYHVQIMDGDVIRRMHACGEAINHVHTAGNPGRHELDDQQEINYPPIMKALLDINYQGYVGQEFIPRGDPLVGLTDAVRLCDVA